MKSKKVKFKNKNEEELVGRLDLPVDKRIHSYCIFAHCFTCNKNLKAIKNISDGLTSSGFGVLRFDFTGLGQSDGAFEDTDFSHNVDDLIAASKFLEDHYEAPILIIGHSLGGTASIFAAHQLDHIKAYVTIGSPFQPEHVSKLLESKMDEIQSEGKAKVNVGGRSFTIKKDFLEDLQKNKIDEFLGDLKKPYLIFHSPQDEIVGVKNAELLYKNAHHPKSFVSLDGADHLMSNPKDSLYVGQVISSWASRYLDVFEKEKELKTKHQVVASLDQNDDFTTEMALGSHRMQADEPEDFGGKNLGPNPYELVSGGLAACTAMTIQMYAKRKKWPVENVEVHINHKKDHCDDCKNINDKNSKIDIFERDLILKGDLDDKQRQRLLEIANKCPVHKTLHSEVEVKTKLLDE
ncbi:bifunctional alpha/beta hydrolase/OsmC family protein [Mesohalobacter halotolerans]|uniref:OsmC family protein n=1 Tax=Mesohalobacter halotolerans TaxID=1883405 RepID=A0A4U5TNL2_9FLAO|nr:bifunctional alpha/beta hydrolase/OsmC family protein [Mesohalobacter halotolerans]MBS3738419.1 OsmC family protein [Psychroflexus sp.]TKS55587.1 OsmC family protein [Mesohalobacter halotolerans]